MDRNQYPREYRPPFPAWPWPTMDWSERLAYVEWKVMRPRSRMDLLRAFLPDTEDRHSAFLSLHLPSREVHRKLRRLIFDRLPPSLPVRERVRRASGAAWRGAFILPEVRSGHTLHDQVAEQRKRIGRLKRTCALLPVAVEGIRLVRDSLDDHPAMPGEFSRFVAEIAPGYGLYTNGGDITAAIIGVLNRLADEFNPESADRLINPKKIPKRVPEPASYFDVMIGGTLKGHLKRKPLARLIFDLRAAVDLPSSSVGAIEQRLRDWLR